VALKKSTPGCCEQQGVLRVKLTHDRVWHGVLHPPKIYEKGEIVVFLATRYNLPPAGPLLFQNVSLYSFASISRPEFLTLAPRQQKTDASHIPSSRDRPMSLVNDYKCDTEFVKLMTRRADVDLTTAALELSRDVSPSLDFRETFSWIDDRAEELSSCVACSKTERKALQEIGRCIAEEQGI